MRPTMSQLHAWEPEQALTTGAAFARQIDEFDDSMDAVKRASETASQSWRGLAADRAAARIDAEATVGNRMSVAGLEVVDVLNHGVGAIAQQRAFVLEIEAELLKMGVVLGEHGEISASLDDEPESVAFAALLGVGLDYVDEADRELSEALGGALQRLGEASNYDAGTGPSKAEVLARVGEIPGDAAGLSTLWRSLSAADKADLLVVLPELGSRAGMPAATRDFYNRERLEEMIGQANARREWLGGELYGLPQNRIGGDTEREWVRLSVQYEAAITRAAGFEAVAAQLAADPRAMLLDIDVAGRGAIALNNPDTATHVTTLVPGTGSNLLGIGGEVDRTKAMLTAAEGVSPGAAHSVIAWAGYDAPQGLLEATDSKYAERGGGLLRDFQSGLRASHNGADAYSTVVGHSYGTTEIGAAASNGGSLDADAVVFLASPGTTVNHVSELSLTGVDPGEIGDHVYATKGATDPVPQYANMGGVVNDVLDIGAMFASVVVPAGEFTIGPLLDGVGDFVEDRFSGPLGTDPTDADRFGGRAFSSDPGSATPVIGWNPDTHSQHWDLVDGKPNQSLQNMAHIMSNQGGQIS